MVVGRTLWRTLGKKIWKECESKILESGRENKLKIPKVDPYGSNNWASNAVGAKPEKALQTIYLEKA